MHACFMSAWISVLTILNDRECEAIFTRAIKGELVSVVIQEIKIVSVNGN
jgi:hypothetical protein